jgi:uncharacterized protein (DUF1684 family)
MNIAIRDLLALAAFAALPAFGQAVAIDPAYVKTVKDWRAKVEVSLKRDNGWLTLAGRYPLKYGENTFGTGKGNDLIFPAGLGPIGMGSVWIEPGKVRIKLVEGFKMKSWDGEFNERIASSSEGTRDWMSYGRTAFHIIERNGKYILRLADNESEVRKSFGHRVWYDVDDNYRVNAKFIAYDPPRKVPIVNILDEVSDEPSPGYVEFEVFGRKYTLDAVGDEEGLFFIFKDKTAGDTTYGSGRFLFVEEKPAPGATFKLDLNRAYNPPCAFSEFTTCPLPPKQNILDTKIEAGEKYPPTKKS